MPTEPLRLRIPQPFGVASNADSVATDESAAADAGREQWIGRTLLKRECCRYLPVSDDRRCGCGRPKSAHASGRSPTSPGEAHPASAFTTYRGERWQANLHSALLPTDAYGRIEFYGVVHSNKAQYARLAHDSQPDDVLHLLLNVWKMEPPRLLISVHGGRSSKFGLQPKIRFAFNKGLVKAARTTSAWIITDGASKGVAEHVGKAIDDYRSGSDSARKRVTAIGIAPWGAVYRKETLVGRNAYVTYNSSATVREALVLNGSHNYFLLADDGSNSRAGADVVLRRGLEQFVSSRKLSKGEYHASSAVPLVCVVLEGDGTTVRTVANYVTSSTPTRVVVVDGSGPAADLIAFAHKHSDDDGRISERLKMQLLPVIRKTFSVAEDAAREILTDLELCMTKKGMITAFRAGNQAEEFDVAILASLLRSHDLTPSQQLALTLMWDRCDVARYQLFNSEQEWPDGALEQALMEALAQDKVAFVQLLIEKGINMATFLTVARLEELYNTVASATPTISMMLRYIRATSLGSPITLIEVGLILDRLMGGDYSSHYCRREFKQAYRGIMQNIAATVNPLAQTLSCDLPNPYSDLLIWAVLTKRQQMAMLMWRHEQEALAKALVAARLYSALSRLARHDPLAGVHTAELNRCSKEFLTLALDLLDEASKRDEVLARQLLVYELRSWSRQTCLELASGGRLRSFLANPCCQKIISDIWMGGLSSNSMLNVKVLCGLLMPAVVPMLVYKTPAMLNELPETAAEHEERERRRSRANSASRCEEQSSPESTAASTVTLYRGSGERAVGVYDQQRDVQDDELVTWSIASPQTPRREDKSGKSSYFQDIQSESASGGSSSPRITHENGSAYNGARNSKTRASQILGITVLHLELPTSRKFIEFYTAPITKFWFHLMAYLCFLAAMTYAVLVDMVWEPHWTEIYTATCVFFQSLDLARKVWGSKPPTLWRKTWSTFSNGWALVKLIAVLGFWIATMVRYLPGPEVQLWGHVLHSLDSIAWFLLVMEYFKVSSHLGPFIVIVGNFWVHLTKFVIFFLVFVIAYGVPRQAIFYPEQEPSWAIIRDVLMEPYFMIYGELYADKIDPPCGDGKEIEVCWPGMWLVPILTSLYLLVTYVLLMNLLIAVFNSAFRKFNSISKQMWMYQRYDLTLKYDEKPVFPPPFVIFSYCWMLCCYLIRRYKGGGTPTSDRGIKLFLSKDETQKLREFEEDCVSALLDEKNAVQAAKAESAPGVVNNRMESLIVKVDDVSQRQNQLHTGLAYLAQKFHAIESTLARTSDDSDAGARRTPEVRIPQGGARLRSTRPDMVGGSASAEEPTVAGTVHLDTAAGAAASNGATAPYTVAADEASRASLEAEVPSVVNASAASSAARTEDPSAAYGAKGEVAAVERSFLLPTAAAAGRTSRAPSPAISITVSLDGSDGERTLVGGRQRGVSVQSASDDAFPSSYVERSLMMGFDGPLGGGGAGFGHLPALGGGGLAPPSATYLRRCSQSEYTSTTDCIEPVTFYSPSVTPRDSLSSDGSLQELSAALVLGSTAFALPTVRLDADGSAYPTPGTYPTPGAAAEA